VLHTRTSEESAPVPYFSVVIPVHAASRESVDLLCNALRALESSSFREFEVLVADDGSPLRAAVEDAAASAGARLVRLDSRRGPAAARNAAAGRARGEILVFVDADTSVHPDTLERFVREFREHPGLAAAFGSYDRYPTAPGIVSQFRNLLHTFVHHRSRRQASTFWAACGAVRRQWFHKLGGFEESYTRPSVEDVEFGLRLREAGGAIALNPHIQVSHHKAWTLASMVRTDFFQRAIPWTALLYRYPLPADLNFKLSDRASVVLMAAVMAAGIIAARHGGLWWLTPLLGLALIGALNAPLLAFLARARGRRRAALCFPLLLAYLATCVGGFLAGWVLREHRRDRWWAPMTAAIAAALLAVQIAGGAYQAEFTGHPDEAAHFVSGLMAYDYLSSLPRENPLEWAEQYYLHYPKVAIGQWPPGYPAMQAVWWLFWDPSRTSAMLLQGLIALAALSVLYRLCRPMLPLPIIAGVLAFTIAAPVFQAGLGQTMAELPILLWSVLLMHAAVRLMERPDHAALFMMICWLCAAALTKGSAVALALLPAAAWLHARRSLRVPFRWIVAAGVCLLAAAGWYFWMGGVRSWGGMSFEVSWHGELIGHVAGWGFLVLALLGIRRTPLAVAAVSILAGTLAASFFMRAFREERHFIVVLPAILVLAGIALARFRRRWIPAILVLGAAAFFPFSWYRQSRSGYAELIQQLDRPARMLISSASDGEGPWVAMSSLAETRPGSLIARASKVLAQSDWFGEDYSLLTPTPAAILHRLDQLALDLVILHTPPRANPPAHHVLLDAAMRGSPSWQPCRSVRELTAYCRARDPQAGREPLRLKVRGRYFEERF
jgi:GT2 family glycosyltransferase